MQISHHIDFYCLALFAIVYKCSLFTYPITYPNGNGFKWGTLFSAIFVT